jgi:hypothetical protein
VRETAPRGVRKAVGIRRGAISGNMKVSFQAPPITSHSRGSLIPPPIAACRLLVVRRKRTVSIRGGRFSWKNLKLVAPAEVNRTVPPTRRPNAELRTREHLTPGEVEALIEAAKANRCGHRDATMVLLAFRHGLRAAEFCDLLGQGGVPGRGPPRPAGQEWPPSTHPLLATGGPDRRFRPPNEQISPEIETRE